MVVQLWNLLCFTASLFLGMVNTNLVSQPESSAATTFGKW
jgi:hypothetical protein